MSAKKPMGAFWAILAVPEDGLGGRRGVLLARMFLLDNGSRGCYASAKVLGTYTGLSERTVEKYRAELAKMGLVYPVTGTRAWHVALPAGMPPDRATDAEILAYACRIAAAAGAPAAIAELAEESRTRGSEPLCPEVGEGTPPVVATYASHRTDTTLESTPRGGESVVNGVVTSGPGLTSTQETHEKTLMSALRRNGKGTHEEQRANPDGELTDASNLEAKRRVWREAAQQAPTPVAPETAA